MLITVQIAKAQHYFSKTHFDVGEISQVNQDIIELNIVNRSNQSLYLLRADASPGISIRYSSRKLDAGQAILLRLKLNPKKKGNLTEPIKVHLSSNETPISLVFDAEIIKVPKDERQSCPDFSSKDIAIQTQAAFLREKKGEANKFFVSLYSVDQVIEEVEKEEVVIASDTISVPIEDLASANKPEKRVSEEVQAEVKPPLLEQLFEKPKSLDTITLVENDASQLLSENALPNNIVFLIDASSSMEENNKMRLLKATMIDLLEILRAKDYLSIISYSGDAQVLLSPTSGINKQAIREIIDSIPIGGHTRVVKGIKKAIEVGHSAYIEGGNNQIILASDGAFDIGSRNLGLREKIKENAKNGLKMSVLAIKNDPSSRPALKEIVQLGKGTYIKVKSQTQIDNVSNAIKKQVEKRLY